jgi:hypothetical protein
MEYTFAATAQEKGGIGGWMRLRSMRVQLLLLLALVMAIATEAPSEQTWTEIRSPHFRVLTDASASDGRRVANEFEQMRNVFAVRFGDGEDVRTGPPLTILAASDERTFRELEPGLWKAKNKTDISAQFHSRWERQFASIRLDTWQGAQQVPVYYEYTQSFLHANVRWLPVWLEVGLGEFYSYTTFQHDRVLVGAPSLRSGTLKSMVLIPVSTMQRGFSR